MCLKAQGISSEEATTEMVNRVMGARPMQGASWEDALACAQHYGMRATLVVPATLRQVKEWTDRGVPVMIAWNPEGRDWSHASVVFDVDDDMKVSVADPNIPDPDQTVRIVTKDEFYHKWFEKWPNYLVRRPAMAIEREITPEGRQVQASARKVAEAHDCLHDYQVGGLTYQEYQDCLKQFEEKDRGRHKPQMSLDQRKEHRVGVRGLLLALLKDGKYRSREWDFASQRFLSTDAMSPKQQAWFEGLVRRYHGFIRGVPKGLLHDLDSLILYAGNLSVEDKFGDWANSEFETVAKGGRVFLKGPRKAGPPPKDPAGLTFGREHLAILADYLTKRPGDRFMTSMVDLVRQGKTLSEAQLKAIRQNLYRAGMRQGADRFRPPENARLAGYSGNPDGGDIYPHEIDHGYNQPLSGGWDIMKRLQDRLLIEQGRPPREPNPRLASRVASRFFEREERK